jgi:nitroreductase
VVRNNAKIDLAETMGVLNTIKNRRSIREFADQQISPEDVEVLIEAIRWAPSAGNLQSRKFYFVFNNEVRKKLARAAGNPDLPARMKTLVKIAMGRHFVSKAPLVVVACLDRTISARYGERGVSLYGIQDVAASIMNMMLTAHELGLGSVWVGAFDENDVSAVLDLPGKLRPVALVPVGFPAKVPVPTSRIAKDEAVVFMR